MRKILIASLLFLGTQGQNARCEDITGQVLGPDDKPVADAVVVVNRWGGNSNKPLTLRSDEQGQFSTPATDEKYGNISAYKKGQGTDNIALYKNKPPFILKLMAGLTLRGLVKDSAGKPVGGIVVRLKYVMTGRPMGRGIYKNWQVPDALESAFSARTGEDGRWKIENVPQGDTARVVLTDEKFVATPLQIKLTGTEVNAPDLLAKPGANVTGRVVYEDGKPAAGIRVIASAVDYSLQSFAEAQSAADGTFRLTGLAASAHKVDAYAPTDEWVCLQKQQVPTKAGQSVAAPDLVLSHGALVQGTVTDAQTGAPLANVSIGGGEGSKGGLSDKDGIYKLRLAPGDHGVYVMGILPEYLQPKNGSPSQTIRVSVEKNEIKTLDFKLRKGFKWSGRVVDEAGQPVDAVKLTLTPTGDNGRFSDFGNGGVSDKGSIEVVGLAAGAYSIAAADDWKVVSPETLDIQGDTEGRIVVSAFKALATKGRIVDTDGAPVEAAAVVADILVPRGPGSFNGYKQEIDSDKDGRFVVTDLRPGYEVKVRASKAGYRYVSGGGVTAGAEGFQAADIVLMRLSARLEGRVTDTAGHPVAGALVMVPGNGLESRVATDAEGKFSLVNLPPGEATIVVAGASGAMTSRRRLDGTPDTLVIRPWPAEPGIDAELANSIIDESWQAARGKEARSGNRIIALQSLYDLDDALALAAEENGAPSEQALQGILSLFTDEDRADHAEWRAAKLESVKEPYTRLYLISKLALKIAATKPALANSLYALANKIPPGDEPMAVIYRPFILSALAARLGKKQDADDWYQQGLVQLPPPDMDRDGKIRAVVDALAEGSEELAERAMALLPEDAEDKRIMARRSAIVNLAEYDLAGAQRMLEKIRTSTSSQQGYGYGDAVKKIIEVLGPRDPQAALALARTVNDSNTRSAALAAAAKYQPKDSALPLLRDAYLAIPGGTWVTGQYAEVAYQAYLLDKATGTELLQDAHQRILDKLQNSTSETASWRNQQGAHEIAVFAYAYRHIDPAESRLLIEDEFTYRTQIATDTDRNYQLKDLITAMAALDFQRARELIRETPQENHLVLELQLVRFLRTAPEERGKLMSRF